MSLNPYAAPQTAIDYAPSFESGTTSGPQPWGIEEVFSIAFAAFKRHAAVVIGTLLVGYVFSFVAGLVLGALAGAVFGDVLGQVVAQLVSMVLSSFLGIGWIRIWLAAARGGEPTFEMLLSGSDRLLPMLGVTFLYYLAVLGGTLALVVPGIILGVGLYFSLFFIADTNMGVMEALKASWEASSGQRGKMLLAALASLGLVLLGTLACLVGLLVAVPVSFIAAAVVYTRISGRTGAPQH